jgi:pyruvate kinase
METMASAAVAATLTMPIDLIIVSSLTGKMARFVAKYKPAMPILCCTTDYLVVKQLGIVRGVIPLEVKEDSMDPGSLIAKA